RRERARAGSRPARPRWRRASLASQNLEVFQARFADLVVVECNNRLAPGLVLGVGAATAHIRQVVTVRLAAPDQRRREATARGNANRDGTQRTNTLAPPDPLLVISSLQRRSPPAGRTRSAPRPAHLSVRTGRGAHFLRPDVRWSSAQQFRTKARRGVSREI